MLVMNNISPTDLSLFNLPKLVKYKWELHKSNVDRTPTQTSLPKHTHKNVIYKENYVQDSDG